MRSTGTSNAVHFSDADPSARFYRAAPAFKQTETLPKHGLFEQRVVAKEARIESDITVGCEGRDCQSGGSRSEVDRLGAHDDQSASMCGEGFQCVQQHRPRRDVLRLHLAHVCHGRTAALGSKPSIVERLHSAS